MKLMDTHFNIFTMSWFCRLLWKWSMFCYIFSIWDMYSIEILSWNYL